MPAALILDAVRSPMGRGKPDGALAPVHPVDLLGQILGALVERTGIDPATVEDVVTGCVTQVREQSACVGRQAWLAAGLPESVPSTTVDRRCGSAQQALQFAAQGVMSGTQDLVIAAGVESMSRVPILSNRLDADPFGPSVNTRYAPGLIPQGVAAELVATRWGLDRARMDDYASRSHQRAASAAADGRLAREIVPIGTVTADETIRPETTTERLAGLRTVFRTDAYAARFPEIDWSVTAGSSSQIADGAGAALVASPQRAAELGLRPRARIHAFTAVGGDPVEMLTAPIPATRRLLERTGLRIDDIDHFEVNEAFASVPLAWQTEFDVPDERLNPRGGAIALGHPLGASGLRLATSLLCGLEETDGRYGLQVMCEAGGMANAMLIERLEDD
jgi:acetyl-CoA acetyltransferase family protein